MTAAHTIQIGADSNAPFLAFGDDSQHGDCLAFAFVIVDRNRLPRLQGILNDLKSHFAIPSGTSLHCRVLFNEHARQKADLGHLGHKEVQTIFTRAVRLINREELLVTYAVCQFTDFKKSIGDELELFGVDGSPNVTHPVTHDPKAVLGILANACLCQLGPGASQCQIIVSQDATKVGFIGPRKRRADNIYSGFSSIGAPNDSVYQFSPKVVRTEDAPLLQLADVAAYLCSHAHCVSRPEGFFHQQLRLLRRWKRSVLVPGLEPHDTQT